MQSGNEESSVQLVLTDTSTAFVCGASALDVPSSCATQSALISELREQCDGEVQLTLHMPILDFEAWLACAGSDGATRAAAFAAAGNDEALLRALKVRDSFPSLVQLPLDCAAALALTSVSRSGSNASTSEEYMCTCRVVVHAFTCTAVYLLSVYSKV